MSHISTYQTKVNVSTFINICKKHGLEVIEGKQTVHQFGRNKVDCIASVLLPGWRYKVAITKNGEVKYDHFGSKVNSFDQLGKLIQEHNVELVNQNIPHHEVSIVTEISKDNGDIIIELEY